MSSVVKSVKIVKRSERQVSDSPGVAKTESQLRREMVEIVGSWILERREVVNSLATCKDLMLMMEAESSS
jgi:hypothetical protein